jgi:hypothetical protein
MALILGMNYTEENPIGERIQGIPSEGIEYFIKKCNQILVTAFRYIPDDLGVLLPDA